MPLAVDGCNTAVFLRSSTSKTKKSSRFRSKIFGKQRFLAARRPDRRILAYSERRATKPIRTLFSRKNRCTPIALSRHESITTHLSSDVCGYLHSGSRSLYFGQLPSKDNAIEINSPDRATLYVFPSDQKSIIVRYEPRNGIKRTYKISGFGDFNSVLQALYQLTDNAVFNETIAY